VHTNLQPTNQPNNQPTTQPNMQLSDALKPISDALQPLHRSEPAPKPGPLASSITGGKYRDLTPNEELLLAMLDRFAPKTNPVAWPCDFETMIRMAQRKPAIPQDRLIAALASLPSKKVIDYQLAVVEGKLQIWVSLWVHRKRLAHELITLLHSTSKPVHAVQLPADLPTDLPAA